MVPIRRRTARMALVLAGCMAVIVCLPALLHLLGLTVLIARSSHYTADLAPANESDSYFQRYHQLVELGFDVRDDIVAKLA